MRRVVVDADEFGHCVVRAERVSGELEAQAGVGEQNCPEHAITVHLPAGDG
ncbi:hypothetical protein MLM_1940 [Mycobacterium lepraemurium]|nr:hypothetical protein MLM_1940 [Mycobacterium lepraemurium]